MNTTLRRIFLFVALMSVLIIPALALADGQSGTITGNAVNLREGPGTSYARLCYLYKGDRVTVNDAGNSWYAVTYGTQSGYVYGSYVALSGQTEQAPSAASGLSRGSTGSAVKTLQGNLIMLGYLNDRADGRFGAKTEAAVKLYQKQNKLTASGVADATTNKAIQREVLRVLKVIDTAKAYLGTPYVYGGSSPQTGFDCSGLVQYAHAQASIDTPRVSYEQARAGIAVPRDELRIGDVVCFNSPVSHVGIYMGSGRFIHAPKTGDVVKLTNLSAMNLTAIRRYTGVRAG